MRGSQTRSGLVLQCIFVLRLDIALSGREC
jgi:hypothetical protein